MSIATSDSRSPVRSMQAIIAKIDGGYTVTTVLSIDGQVRVLSAAPSRSHGRRIEWGFSAVAWRSGELLLGSVGRERPSDIPRPVPQAACGKTLMDSCLVR